MKSRLDYFVILLLGMVSFISLIRAIFPMQGWRFYIELLATVILAVVFMLAIILVFNKVNPGYVMSAVVGALILANLLIIFYRSTMDTNLFLGMIASMTLFVLSIVTIPGHEEECECCEQTPLTPEPVAEQVKVEAPKAEFKPGKYVSSKTASYYHVPTCDWAQKIKPNNQVWFDTEHETKKAGLKPHNCIKHS